MTPMRPLHRLRIGGRWPRSAIPQAIEPCPDRDHPRNGAVRRRKGGGGQKITLTGGGGSGERHFDRLTTGRRSAVSQIDAALGGGVRRVEGSIGGIFAAEAERSHFVRALLKMRIAEKFILCSAISSWKPCATCMVGQGPFVPTWSAVRRVFCRRSAQEWQPESQSGIGHRRAGPGRGGGFSCIADD